MSFGVAARLFVRLKKSRFERLLQGRLLPQTRPEELPRIVWLYWNQGYEAAPEIVRYCIDLWIKNNPDWHVRSSNSADGAEIC